MLWHGGILKLVKANQIPKSSAIPCNSSISSFVSKLPGIKYIRSSYGTTCSNAALWQISKDGWKKMVGIGGLSQAIWQSWKSQTAPKQLWKFWIAWPGRHLPSGKLALKCLCPTVPGASSSKPASHSKKMLKREDSNLSWLPLLNEFQRVWFAWLA